ncbi:MAG: hypothetical protein US89_C0009G0057 [Candidatus Peregrinibacteria bacterium GW2011_GWF2_38_29]|nr:MAG: hypothetical protein US89_C0009G0057 [Candidatus Peregrinibacteria bacterium GW2011_GWF2_38_29]HBB02761.1 hypothetical protein [Candidatus Peregrinibacteria bacterium]
MNAPHLGNGDDQTTERIGDTRVRLETLPFRETEHGRVFKFGDGTNGPICGRRASESEMSNGISELNILTLDDNARPIVSCDVNGNLIQ